MVCSIDRSFSNPSTAKSILLFDGISSAVLVTGLSVSIVGGFARRQHWENIKSERAVEKMGLYAKYDYANYIRTFYPDEAK